MKAHLLTIGTEITCGEVVNSNAAWISTRLEDMGVRVLSHVTVRDQVEEILRALRGLDGEIVVVTGGLGPTSDDKTRECLAEFFAQPLEFDDLVWRDLEQLYRQRQLPLREAHRHQCHFPKNSERLNNPSGTALGFYFSLKTTHYFALPGPPRELEAMWRQEVEPRLKQLVPKSGKSWHRWTYLAVPESEVAELVERVIAGTNLEVGYRAQVPYVKVKLLVDPVQQQNVLHEMERLLPEARVPADKDLAEELLTLWLKPHLRVRDTVSEGQLAVKLHHARHLILQKGGSPSRIEYSNYAVSDSDVNVLMDGDGFRVEAPSLRLAERKVLPFKIPIDSERGRRYAIELALWMLVKSLKT